MIDCSIRVFDFLGALPVYVQIYFASYPEVMIGMVLQSTNKEFFIEKATLVC